MDCTSEAPARQNQKGSEIKAEMAKVISLQGKTVLVTGAAGGLGRCIVAWMHEAGANVASTDLQVSEDLQMNSMHAEADKSRPLSSRIAWAMDLRNPTQIREVVQQVGDTFGTIDVLVNNAGLMGNFALLEQQTEKVWEETLRVNLTGAFHCTQAVWPKMRKQRWGRIINISSIAGSMGAFAQPAYGASKAGLIGLTQSLATEGARYGITVNAVLPGLIDTAAARELAGGALEKMAAGRIPLKRPGLPEDVAASVVFLASELSGYITGVSLPITGGLHLLKP